MQVGALQQGEPKGGQEGMKITYMISKRKGAYPMGVKLLKSLHRRSSQGGSAMKTTAWRALRQAM